MTDKSLLHVRIQQCEEGAASTETMSHTELLCLALINLIVLPLLGFLIF